MKFTFIFTACLAVVAFSQITGLTFSADTVYGWKTDQQPQGFSIVNSTENDITIDSMVETTDTNSFGNFAPLGYCQTPGGEMSPANWHFSWNITIKAKDSFTVSSVSFIGLLLQRSAGLDESNIPVVGTFYSGSESKKMKFYVMFNGIGKIEASSPAHSMNQKFQVSPNPFSSSLRISNLYPHANGKLEIFDLNGACVQSMDAKSSCVVDWKPMNVPAGYYFIKYRAGHEAVSQRVLFLR